MSKCFHARIYAVLQYTTSLNARGDLQQPKHSVGLYWTWQTAIYLESMEALFLAAYLQTVDCLQGIASSNLFAGLRLAGF